MNRTMTTILAAGVGALCAVSARGGEDASRLLFAAQAGAMRDYCATNWANIGHFAKFIGDARADSDWGAVRAEFGDKTLLDFFMGAGMHIGPSDADSCVCAMYNPWWDAILLLELSGEPKPGQGFEKQAKVVKLKFVGGEVFRGEAVGGRPSVLTVVPDKNPLSLEIWRVEARTLARFRELCPQAGRIRFPRGFGTGAGELGWESVQARAALRLKLLGEFAKLDDYGRKQGSSKLVLVAAKMQEALRNSDARMLRRHFPDQAHAFFCDTFAGLPGNIRKGFGLYGYIPSREGTLFIFLSPSMPRVYATVSFPRNRENDPKAGSVIFEWYDLAKAPELLKAWKTTAAPAR